MSPRPRPPSRWTNRQRSFPSPKPPRPRRTTRRRPIPARTSAPTRARMTARCTARSSAQRCRDPKDTSPNVRFPSSPHISVATPTATGLDAVHVAGRGPARHVVHSRATVLRRRGLAASGRARAPGMGRELVSAMVPRGIDRAAAGRVRTRDTGSPASARADRAVAADGSAAADRRARPGRSGHVKHRRQQYNRRRLLRGVSCV